jgi:hypothetical protein
MNHASHTFLKFAETGCAGRFNFRAHKTSAAGSRPDAAAGAFSLRRVRNGALLKVWRKFLRDT